MQRTQKLTLLGPAFAARQGLEPRYHGPKPCVLPLDDRAIFFRSYKDLVREPLWRIQYHTLFVFSAFVNWAIGCYSIGMKSTQTIIAWRNLVAVAKGKTERMDISIQVHLPYTDDGGSNYFCTIDFAGLDDIKFTVGGVDSLQALSLAILELKRRFETLREESYDFFWPDDGIPMDSIDFAIITT